MDASGRPVGRQHGDWRNPWRLDRSCARQQFPI